MYGCAIEVRLNKLGTKMGDYGTQLKKSRTREEEIMELPIIELKIRDLGRQVAAHIAVQENEIKDLINKGVENALSNIKDKIISQAMEEATQRISSEIEHYFTYGYGAKAISTAVEQISKPISDIVKKEED